MEYRYLYGGRTTNQGMKGPIARFQTLRSPGKLMGLPVPESEMLEETNQCLWSHFRFFPATAGSYKPNFFIQLLSPGHYNLRTVIDISGMLAKFSFLARATITFVVAMILHTVFISAISISDNA